MMSTTTPVAPPAAPPTGAATGSRLDAETRRSMLRHMILAMRLDEEAQRLQKLGQVDLWPSARGHEALQVACALAIGPDPTVVPCYREHAVAFTRGIDPAEVVAQWAGSTFCGWDPWRHRFFPSTLVMGAHLLSAVGYALGRRLQGRATEVVTFFGDGASSEGEACEALNLAAVESAPVLFICQNNGWAISKPVASQMRTSIAARAEGFGIASTAIAGTDPEVVHDTCSRALAYVREHRAPYLIEARVDRMLSHTSADAQELYRTPEDIGRAAAADPVRAYRDRLTGEGIVDAAWLAAVEDAARNAQQRLIEAISA